MEKEGRPRISNNYSFILVFILVFLPFFGVVFSFLFLSFFFRWKAVVIVLLPPFLVEHVERLYKGIFSPFLLCDSYLQLFLLATCFFSWQRHIIILCPVISWVLLEIEASKMGLLLTMMVVVMMMVLFTCHKMKVRTPLCMYGHDVSSPNRACNNVLFQRPYTPYIRAVSGS